MLKKTLISILIILLLMAISGYFYFSSKIPQRDGELILDGLSAPVQVLFDNYGIPHLTAENDGDLYRAFGYVHAQDRLFQMEMLRRLSQGRLAEIFGEKLLDVDKLFRTLGLQGYSKRWLAAMEKRGNQDLFATTDSYLAGINEYVKNGTRPIEFELLGFPEHLYTREDIASVAGYMAFSFAFGLKDDPLVDHLSKALGRDYLVDLGIEYTPGFEQIPVDAMETKIISQKVSNILQQLTGTPLFHGSNSWLISPSRTQSGKAMLVNDPHIGYSQPNIWYEAQLKSDKIDIYGHFLALTPFAQLGFNRDIAWGLTMFENDDMDLYVEKINPKNPNQYWVIDHWAAFDSRIEIIKVKGQDSLLFEVRESRHGPIINSIYQDNRRVTNAVSEIKHPVSLWWAFKNTDNQIMEGFYQLPKIKTLEQAAEVASKIHAPGLNLMFTNAQGDIGWWASAKLPIRPTHVNSKMLLDGSSGKDDILGYYDFSHNPQKTNPASGVLYSSNNQPADMGDGLVPGYYAPTDRARRIVELLAQQKKLTPEFMKKMLVDSQSKTGLLFQKIAVPVLEREATSLSEIENKALEIYRNWDGSYRPDQQGATIQTRFRMNLMKLAMQDELGEKFYPGFQFSFLMARSIWRLLPNQESPWWNNRNTDETETRDQLILLAWKKAIAFLNIKHGTNLQSWSWKNEATVVYEHPLGKQKPLDMLFNVGPFPINQGMETINNARLKEEGDGFKITMGPSTRRIIDFGDIENSWGILPTGQSGVAGDKHYDDQALDYSNGKFRPQYITEDQVLDNLEGRLVFLP